jgi:uncharacterized membrane protein YtjA (UPF0391 family)
MNGRAFLVRVGAGARMPGGLPVEMATSFGGFFMLSWALTFFIVAIIAAVLGFTTIAGAAACIAKILFFIFLVLTLVALVAGALRGRPPV